MKGFEFGLHFEEFTQGNATRFVARDSAALGGGRAVVAYKDMAAKGHRVAGGVFDEGDEFLEEGWGNCVVGMEDVKEFGFGCEAKGAVVVGEKAEVAFIGRPFAFNIRKVLDDFAGAVGGTVVNGDDTIGPACLAREGFEGLGDVFFAVVNRDDGGDRRHRSDPSGSENE